MKYKNILIFDFETTGLSSFMDEIIEIGAILLEKSDNGKYELKNELSCLVEASKPLSPKICEITNITDEMLLKEGITQEEAFQKLSNLYDENTLLIAYNIQFDLGFLIALFKDKHDKNFLIKNDLLDVMAIYKDRYPFPHRLESAVSTLNVSIPNTHRALDDVKATFEVLKTLLKEKNNIDEYINVIGFNEKYGLSGPKLPHIKYVPQGSYKKIVK